ncbi:hypothetical protein QUB37_17645 [Microcoleus sp. AT3-A2]|uniref:hypothetical protein n=1 Tax=Microcoleus sp. AT3-A2 TaxID=2818610 RepID=UPI002FCF61DD
MDFLVAIPSFIIHLISSLFSWVFSVLSGIVGIFLLPVKLVWGLLMGVGKTLISIVLLPTLLFSHPADISLSQPVVATNPTIPNNNLELIFNDIKRLEFAGRNMEPLRTQERLGQCGDKMREYQKQAENLVEITDALPMSYKVTLGIAAGDLKSCVSCMSSAQDSCKLVRMGLSDYQSMMSEE